MWVGVGKAGHLAPAPGHGDHRCLRGSSFRLEPGVKKPIKEPQQPTRNPREMSAFVVTSH